MPLPNIAIGSRIRITKDGREIIGTVQRVLNSPNTDTSFDEQCHWDLEYTILQRSGIGGYARGSYGRWKQWTDGGEVELLSPAKLCTRAKRPTFFQISLPQWVEDGHLTLRYTELPPSTIEEIIASLEERDPTDTRIQPLKRLWDLLT